GLVRNDRFAPPDEPVEQAGFSDIRPANDCYGIHHSSCTDRLWPVRTLAPLAQSRAGRRFLPGDCSSLSSSAPSAQATSRPSAPTCSTSPGVPEAPGSGVIPWTLTSAPRYGKKLPGHAFTPRYLL